MDIILKIIIIIIIWETTLFLLELQRNELFAKIICILHIFIINIRYYNIVFMKRIILRLDFVIGYLRNIKNNRQSLLFCFHRLYDLKCSPRIIVFTTMTRILHSDIVISCILSYRHFSYKKISMTYFYNASYMQYLGNFI